MIYVFINSPLSSLTSFQTIVYSYLANAAKFDSGIKSVQRTAKILACSRVKLGYCLTQLKGLGLVVVADQVWKAVEPPKGWFEPRATQSKHWSDHFEFYKLQLFTSAPIEFKSKLSRSDNQILSYLYFYSTSQPGRAVAHSRIAAKVGLTRKTVYSSINKLAKLGLLKIAASPYGSFVYQVTELVNSFWRSDKTSSNPEAAISEPMIKPTVEPVKSPEPVVAAIDAVDEWEDKRLKAESEQRKLEPQLKKLSPVITQIYKSLLSHIYDIQQLRKFADTLADLGETLKSHEWSDEDICKLWTKYHNRWQDKGIYYIYKLNDDLGVLRDCLSTAKAQSDCARMLPGDEKYSGKGYAGLAWILIDRAFGIAKSK